ncbi:13387_t:CDS:1 [Cetraspora pellucida]|uniref:ribonuclease III n=1 Tax=Cetraspora pellucida TaxID=1433469 RepID=A0A9N9FF96_9GLOM|nr:13387_t:CDS:1 [Cetraspora pellucida]
MGEIKRWNFNKRNLETEAFTHKSFASEKPENGPHNERLEWIGDSIISAVVADYLFFRFPDYKEGTLTTLRSNIVCKEALAGFARKLGLDKELLLGIGALAAGDRKNDRILEDTFEAYIGAIYLDCNKNLNEVIKFMKPIIEPFVDDLVANSGNGLSSSPTKNGVVYGPMNKPIESDSLENPIGKLQNWAQSRGFEIPEYKFTEKQCENKQGFECEVIIKGKSYGIGWSGNKKDAKKKSAINALESISA